MSLSRISSRFPRIVSTLFRYSFIAPTRHHHPSSQFHSLVESHCKVVASQVSLFHNSFSNVSAFQRFGFSSVPSPENPEKDNSANGGSTVENNGATAKASGDAKAPEKREGSISEDSDEELSIEDLVKLVTEKEELLKVKHKEIEKMQDKVLHTYADMKNIMDRAKRDSEKSKKFAIQNFAQSVADNLGRASSVVKESFSKIDTSKDTAGVVPLLKTLLEDVEMTEKDLIEVVGGRTSLLHLVSQIASASQQLGFSSVPPSPEKPEKENSPPAKGRSTVRNNGAKAKASGNAESPEQREEPISEDSEKKLTIKDMLKLVIEREKLQMAKLKEIEKMQKEVSCSNQALRFGAMCGEIREIREIRESVLRHPICYCCEIEKMPKEVNCKHEALRNALSAMSSRIKEKKN